MPRRSEALEVLFLDATGHAPTTDVPFPVRSGAGGPFLLLRGDDDGVLQLGEHAVPLKVLRDHGLLARRLGGYLLPLRAGLTGTLSRAGNALRFAVRKKLPVKKDALPAELRPLAGLHADPVFSFVLVAVLLTNFACMRALSARPLVVDEPPLAAVVDRFLPISVVRPDLPKPKPSRVHVRAPAPAPAPARPAAPPSPGPAAPSTFGDAGLIGAIRHAEELGGGFDGVFGAHDVVTDLSNALEGATRVASLRREDSDSRRGPRAGNVEDIGPLRTNLPTEVRTELEGPAAPHRPPTIVPQPPEPEPGGSCDTAAIARTVRQNLLALQHCYDRAVTRQPNLKGRVELRISIERGGRVDEVEVEESELESDELLRCVQDRVRRWVFPSSRDGCVVSHPFVFAPAG